MPHLPSLGAIVDSTLSAYPKGGAKLLCALHATGIDLTARARVRRLCRFIASESTMISGASQHRSRAFSRDLPGHCANTRSAKAVRHGQSLRAACGDLVRQPG